MSIIQEAEIDVGHYMKEVASGIVTPPKTFVPRTLAELMELPPKEWVIDQVAGVGDLLMMYGAPGSGKTFAVIDLILSACTGKDWANRFEIQESLVVAYCAGEGLSGLAGRFQSAAQYYGVEELPSFSFYDKVPQLFIDAKSTDAVDAITRFVIERDEPLDLLVIDTFHSATAGADENSAQHAGSIVKRLREAAQKMDCAIILVHHSNKAGTGERGSSALRGAMDCMIEVRQLGNRFGIECAKLKDGQQWIPQQFDLIAKGESARVDWDQPKLPDSSTARQSTIVLELLSNSPETPYTAKQISEVLRSTPRVASNVLSKMVENGEIERELSETEKKQSSRNPWVYFFTGEKAPLP